MVQAKFRTEAGDEEVVAVKKLNYYEGMEIRKFSNVRISELIAYYTVLTRFE